MDWLEQAFSFSGHIGVARYLSYWLLSRTVAVASGVSFAAGPGDFESPLVLLALILLVGGSWVGLASTVKRLRDGDLSFWLFLWAVAGPVGGVVLFIYAIVSPSRVKSPISASVV